MKTLLRLFLSANILFLCVSTVPATTWYVKADATGDAPTIQAGIDSAVGGDIVLVAEGIYVGTGNRDLDFNGKEIVLMSENGPEETIINCEESGRGVIFQNSETGTSLFDGFTITRSDSVIYGGAMFVDSLCSPAIQNCIFSHNKVTVVGASMVQLNGSPSFSNCTFRQNSTTAGLGAILVYIKGSPTFTECHFSENVTIYRMIFENSYYGAPVFNGCTFTDNSTTMGGLIITHDGSFVDCVFTGNTSTGTGFWDCGMLAAIGPNTFLNCIMSGNSAIRAGGVNVYGLGATFTGCQIVGNSATEYGGGIYIQSSSGSDATFTGCTITGNRSGGRGGGVHMDNDFVALYGPTFDNCTISGNYSVDGGGGISIHNDQIVVPDTVLNLDQTIVWGNCSDSGPNEIFDTKGVGVAEYDIYANCCDLDSSEVVTAANVHYDSTTICVDPIFCGPESCASAPSTAGDYTLALNSPCLPGQHPNGKNCGRIGSLDGACNPTGIEEECVKPARAVLWQNIPNPFNPNTTIFFTIPERTYVNLSVYNIEGKLVATLVDDTLNDGLSEVTWDGKDSRGNPVSSGVYFYRLTAGNRTLTKKMVFLK